MNEDLSASRLNLSTVNLSIDGAHVTPDRKEASVPVSQTEALAALQAFARLTAMELVDVEAKIYLSGPQAKMAVQNVGGKLFAAQLPEAVNPATESTPEEIIARLMAGDPAASAAAGTEAAVVPDAVRPAGGWRRRWLSGWTAATLAVVAAVLAYVNFAPATAEGVAIIRDPAKIASLHARCDGRYGAPPATILVLDRGRLTGQQVASGGDPTPLFAMNYQFGQRGDQVVLVVDNGALLEPQPDGSLKFMDSLYPRQTR